MTDARGLLDSLLAPPQKDRGDPLDRELANVNRQRALGAILTSTDNPDTAARASEIAHSFGVPSSTVLRNLGTWNPQARARAWADTLDKYPKMAAWLSDPDNANMAVDDRKALTGLAGAFDYNEWAKRNRLTPATMTSTPAPAPTFWGGVKGLAASFGTWGPSYNMIAQDLGHALGVDAPRGNAMVPRLGDEGKAARREAIASFTEADLAQPQYQSWLARGVYSGLTSAVQMAPGIGLSVALRNPTPALVVAGLQAGIPAYGKYRARGGTAGEAALGGLLEGGIEVATEKLPMGYLVEKFGKIGMGKFLAEYLGRELVSEEAATLAQDAVDTAIANPNKTWGQYLAERPVAALDTAVATLTMSVLAAGGSGAMHRLARGQNEAVSAGADAEFMDHLVGVAADSKTRTRAPDIFAALLKSLGGGSIDNIYVPGEVVEQYLQSDQEHDRAFWDNYGPQIGEAVATGGDVVIPADQAVAHLAGTKAWDALREDARLSPGGMSLREATKFEGDYTGAIEQHSGAAAAQIEADRETMAPRRRLFDAVYTKLTNAGFTPDAARTQAEIVTARYSTRAARMGQEVTGNEFDAVDVNQVLPEGLRPIVAQNALKMTIAAMRKPKFRTAQRGPSLVDWIIAQGGVHDRGGDIASMGGAKLKGIARKGERKLIREHPVDGQGELLGAKAASPHELDTMFKDAIDAGYFPELVGKVTDESGHADAHDTADFLAAIDAELRQGEKRYADNSANDNDRLRIAAQDLYQLLDQNGIDPERATDAEIAKFVQQYQEAASEGRGLEQSYMDGPRGRVTFANGRAVVDLFEKRDLSTFIHESGHIWLEELKADAEHPLATGEIKADWQTVRDWFAASGHAIGDDGVIPTDAHELWARGIERYTMEGKAPSSALRKAFESFRSWLLSIYQVVANLRSPISDEVRGVMDRLLATDDEIASAAEEQNVKALFTDAAQAGMTEAEFAAYQASTTDARDAAHDALLYRTMAAVRAAHTKEYKDQEEAVRREVTESVDNRPEFRAMRLLREKGGMRLDKQWLVETYGADALDLIPASVPPIYSDKATPADAIAEASGFETGDDLVRKLMGMEARRKDMRAAADKRSVRESVIAEETDAIMKDRYGDILNDGTIEREARELIHNDKQGEVIASELRALTRKRPNLTATPYTLAKRWAARKVAEGTVADYTSRAAVAQFQRAARKAGAAAEAAMLKGNIDETFRQKQSQMLNNALVAEASKAADAVEKAVSRLGKVAKRRTMKNVDQGYLEQAQALLEQVELRQRSQVSIDKQGAFEAWALEREAEGHDVVAPPSFAASLGTTHYSRLSVEKLLGLDETVSQIMHLGRLKQTLLDGKEQREFDAVVAEAQVSAAMLPPKPPSDLMEPGWAERFKSGVAGADAALLRMETVFDWLDNGNAEGVFNRVVFRPIAEAQHNENNMLADYYGRIKQAMESVPAATLKHWGDKVTVPEMMNRETGNPYVMTRQQLVSAALNMGNEGNIQRLTDGYGWNETSIREALNRELTAEEWLFVQQVWDVIDTLWPAIEQLERSINGIAPEKVEAKPLETPHGTLKGGYFPAIYDSSKSLDAEKNAGKAGDLFETLYTRSTTRASSTKDRSSKVKRPILLQLGVINRHLGEVIHDITHREAVMNADKFLSSRRVMSAIDGTLGPEIRKQFRPWLKHVANSWAMERAGNEGIAKFINRARTNATVVGMGFRISTIMTQIAGYSNSFEYVGAGWVSEAIAKTAASPIESFKFVMARSGEVAHRMDTLDRDIRESIAKMAGTRNLISDAKRFAFHGIGYADRVVVIPTWIAAYNKALAAGKSEADAIYEGDKAVRMSQGAGSPKDLAAIQRGTGNAGAMLKLFTMFYSYMSTVYQRQRTLGRDVAGAVRERNIRATPKLIARAWWLVVVPPILSELLAGRGPGDDEEWGWWAIKKMLSQALGPIPVVRDLFEPVWNKLAGQPTFGYQLSPMQRAGESLVQVADDAGHVARGKETKHAVKDTMEAAGYITGLVPGQVASASQFLVDVGDGTQHPQDIGDWWEGLTTGKVKEEK